MRYKTATIVPLAAIILFWGCSFFKKDVAKAGPYPEWVKSGILYQVSAQPYPPGETFTTLVSDLSRIKEQGFDILWITGIFPVGEKNSAKGGAVSGSQHAVGEYKTINPEAGTAEEFKKLVTRAHEMGLRVIIDWVADPAPRDRDLIPQYPGRYTPGEKGNPDLNLNRNDASQPDYNRKEVRKALVDAMRFWVQEYDIDGFCCAVAGEVPTGFWERARTELQPIKPLFMIAGDESTRELYRMAFDANYSFAMHQQLKALVGGKQNAAEILEFQSRIGSGQSPRSFRINSFSGDSENAGKGMASAASGNPYKACVLLTYVLPGMPLIFQGQENGLDRLKASPDEPMRQADTTLLQLYKTLNALRHRNQSLWSPPDGGKLVALENDAPDKIISFVRSSGNSRVLVLANMSSDTITTTITSDIADGKYVNVFNQNEIDFNPDNRTSYFEPWGYLVLEGE